MGSLGDQCVSTVEAVAGPCEHSFWSSFAGTSIALSWSGMPRRRNSAKASGSVTFHPWMTYVPRLVENADGQPSSPDSVTSQVNPSGPSHCPISVLPFVAIERRLRRTVDGPAPRLFHATSPG